MGPKLRRRRGQWDQEDVIDLLAHLERFTSDGPSFSYVGLDERQRNARIAKALADLEEKTEGAYTQDEIKQKLLDLYKDRNESKWAEEYNFPIVFSAGTEAMHLDPFTQDLVEKRLAEIRASGKRQPRAATRRYNSSMNPRQSTFGFRVSAHRRRNRLRTTISATPFSNGTATSRQATPAQSTSPKKHTVKPIVIVKIPRSTIPKTNKRSPNSTVDTGDSSRFSQQNDSDDDTGGNEAMTADPQPRSRPPTPQIFMSEAYYEQLLDEVSFAKEKAAQARKLDRTLDRERRESDSFIKKTRGVSIEIMRELRRKNEQIIDLKAQIHNFTFLESYVASSSEFEMADFSNLQNAHANMRPWILSMVTYTGFVTPRSNGHRLSYPDELPDLESLLAKIGSNVSLASTDPMSEAITVSQLVQSLSALAVRDWVFHDKLRCSATLSTTLLEKYRQCVASIQNNHFLCGLDIAAHALVFDDDHFKTVTVPKMAMRLTERLITAFEPLMNARFRYTLEDKLRRSLNGVFREALAIKAKVVASRHVYECIWPDSGSSFNPEIMEIERASRVGDDQRAVRLVLVPGIRVHSSERGMVDYLGFKTADDELSGSSRTLCKAIVLI